MQLADEGIYRHHIELADECDRLRDLTESSEIKLALTNLRIAYKQIARRFQDSATTREYAHLYAIGDPHER